MKSVLQRLKNVITEIDGLARDVVSAVQPVNQHSRKVPIFISRTAAFSLGTSYNFSVQDLYFTNGAESLFVTKMSAITYVEASNLVANYDTISTGNTVRGSFLGEANLGFDWTWNYRLASSGVQYASSANNAQVPFLLTRTSLDWSERGNVLSFNEKRPLRVAAGDSVIFSVKPLSFPNVALTTPARICVVVTMHGYRNGVMAG